MDERLLLFASFFFSILGILALFVMSDNIDHDEVTIEKINQERIESMVKLKGEIIDVSDSGNLTFIRLMQPNYIDVVVFDLVDLVQGDEIEVIGKREEYKRKTEIIAHRIRLISG